MYHPCAACALRFPTTGELEAHIRDEHLRSSEDEGREGIVLESPTFDWSSHRTAFFPDTLRR